eukprot:PhF_6_TR7970/c0_g1_i3/m.12124
MSDDDHMSSRSLPDEEDDMSSSNDWYPSSFAYFKSSDFLKQSIAIANALELGQYELARALMDSLEAKRRQGDNTTTTTTNHKQNQILLDITLWGSGSAHKGNHHREVALSSMFYPVGSRAVPSIDNLRYLSALDLTEEGGAPSTHLLTCALNATLQSLITTSNAEALLRLRQSVEEFVNEGDLVDALFLESMHGNVSEDLADVILQTDFVEVANAAAKIFGTLLGDTEKQCVLYGKFLAAVARRLVTTRGAAAKSFQHELRVMALLRKDILEDPQEHKELAIEYIHNLAERYALNDTEKRDVACALAGTGFLSEFDRSAREVWSRGGEATSRLDQMTGHADITFITRLSQRTHKSVSSLLHEFVSRTLEGGGSDYSEIQKQVHLPGFQTVATHLFLGLSDSQINELSPGQLETLLSETLSLKHHVDPLAHSAWSYAVYENRVTQLAATILYTALTNQPNEEVTRAILGSIQSDGLKQYLSSSPSFPGSVDRIAQVIRSSPQLDYFEAVLKGNCISFLPLHAISFQNMLSPSNTSAWSAQVVQQVEATSLTWSTIGAIQSVFNVLQKGQSDDTAVCVQALVTYLRCIPDKWRGKVIQLILQTLLLASPQTAETGSFVFEKNITAVSEVLKALHEIDPIGTTSALSRWNHAHGEVDTFIANADDVLMNAMVSQNTPEEHLLKLIPSLFSKKAGGRDSAASISVKEMALHLTFHHLQQTTDAKEIQSLKQVVLDVFPTEVLDVLYNMNPSATSEEGKTYKHKWECDIDVFQQCPPPGVLSQTVSALHDLNSHVHEWNSIELTRVAHELHQYIPQFSKTDYLANALEYMAGVTQTLSLQSVGTLWSIHPLEHMKMLWSTKQHLVASSLA